MRPKRRSPSRTAAPEIPTEAQLWMVIDPGTREALRFGEGSMGSGPAFFTSEEALRAYCIDAGIAEYQVHTVPATVLTRMRGKPFWLDTRPCTLGEAARILGGSD